MYNNMCTYYYYSAYLASSFSLSWSICFIISFFFHSCFSTYVCTYIFYICPDPAGCVLVRAFNMSPTSSSYMLVHSLQCIALSLICLLPVQNQQLLRPRTSAAVARRKLLVIFLSFTRPTL